MSPATATLQTPPGRGGIAVITLAGESCREILGGIFRPFRSHTGSADGVLRLGRIVDGAEVIDEAIVCFHGGGCEINIHGGPAVARRVMELLVARGAVACPAEQSAAASFPLAHPRWNNPAIGAEMLAALPSARSELAVRALTVQWSAGLSELAGELLAAAQSGQADASIPPRLRAAADGLSVMRRLLQPAEVVIVGPPNVGKSTLANAVVGRQVSIVDSGPGTTRDWVRELAILAGVPVWLTDTAGLWELATGVDGEAVRRARHRAEQADLVLLLSADQLSPLPAWLHAKNVLRVWARSDLSPPPADFPGPAVSAHSGAGLSELKHAALAALGLSGINPVSPMAFTSRQADLLRCAADALDSADRSAADQFLSDLLTRLT